MPEALHHFAHLISSAFVHWYTFLGTSPGGVVTQIVVLLLTEVPHGGWRLSKLRETWKAGLERALLALGSVWVVVFLACIVTTVYDDHMNLVVAASRLAEKNSNQQNTIAEMNAELNGLRQKIKDLEQRPSRVVVRTENVPVPNEKALQDETQEKERRRQIRAKIAGFVNQGTSIMEAAHVMQERPDLVGKANSWANECGKYLESIDPSYLARFNSSQGLSFSWDNGPPVNENVWNWVRLRNETLNKILEELHD